MAEIAVSLVERLIPMVASIVTKEVNLVRGVTKDARYIQDELPTIRAFLEVFETLPENNVRYTMLKPWAEQVRDLAYDIEDYLEEYLVRFPRPSVSQQLLNYVPLRRHAEQLRDIKTKIREVSERNWRYHRINLDQPTPDDRYRVVIIDREPLSTKDVAGIASFQETEQRLLSGIGGGPTSATEEQVPVIVAAIEGMAGSGKTYLADKMYRESEARFTCRARIRVSETLDVRKVFDDMIEQLFGVLDRTGSTVEVEKIAERIGQRLNKEKFFIVLDDLWTRGAWDRIKIAVSESSMKGSLIIVTTQNFDVAMYCTELPHRIHSIPPLSRTESFQLLKDSILKSKYIKMGAEEKDDLQDLDLEDLNEDPQLVVVAEILRKCERLPLAIRTIGRFLAGCPPHVWKTLLDDLPSLLYCSPELGEIKRAMIRSYKELPPYLKPCFLYLSIFPQDFDIDRENVVHRLVAEGFVRGKTGMTPVDVAYEYLQELFERNLILPSRFNSYGRASRFRIHSIMRGIMAMTSEEQNLVFAVREKQITTEAARKFRHLTVDGGSTRKVIDGESFSRIRSLTVFGKPAESIASLCSSHSKMMRVLDLSTARFRIGQRDIRNIGEVCHLRYLDLCRSHIYELPPSIGRLTSLQVLNVKRTRIRRLPSEITQLQRLSYLRANRMLVHPCNNRECCCCCNSSDGVTVPQGMETLQHLQILDTVDIKNSPCRMIKALGKLTGLRLLGLTGLTAKNSRQVSSALQNLSSLRSLFLRAYGKDGTLSCMHEITSVPPLLRGLRLDGHIGTLPECISSSTSLQMMKLYRTGLQTEDLERVEQIPTLVTLALLENSYEGKSLIFRAGTFPNLQKLVLTGLPKLQKITFHGKEALPESPAHAHSPRKLALPECMLLHIASCKLKILGIKNLRKLREVSLGPGSKVVKLDGLKAEMKNHPNHPRLKPANDTSDHDLSEESWSREHCAEVAPQRRESCTACTSRCRGAAAQDT